MGQCTSSSCISKTSQPLVVISLVNTKNNIKINDLFYFARTNALLKDHEGVHTLYLNANRRKKLKFIKGSNPNHTIEKVKKDHIDIELSISNSEIQTLLNSLLASNNLFYNVILDILNRSRSLISDNPEEYSLIRSYNYKYDIQMPFLNVPTASTNFSAINFTFLSYGFIIEDYQELAILRTKYVFLCMPYNNRNDLETLCQESLLKLETEYQQIYEMSNTNNIAPTDNELSNEFNLSSQDLKQLYVKTLISLSLLSPWNEIIVWRVCTDGSTSLEKLLFDFKSGTIYGIPLVYNAKVIENNVKVSPLRLQLNKNTKVNIGASCQNLINYYDKLEVGDEVAYPENVFYITTKISTDIINNPYSYMDVVSGSNLSERILAYICPSVYMRNELVFFFNTCIEVIH